METFKFKGVDGKGLLVHIVGDGGVRVKPLDMYSGLSGKFDRCLTMDMDQALGHVYEDWLGCLTNQKHFVVHQWYFFSHC